MSLHQFLYDHLLDRSERENSNLYRQLLYPHQSSGVLHVDHTDPLWARLVTDEGVLTYYTWFLQRKGIRLEKPKHGSHISVIRGELSGIALASGGTFDFCYGDLVTNGKHWWLEVRSPAIEAMRVSLGLTPRPKAGLHLTLGRTIKKV